MLEILKVIFLGIIEGITEWLPISSTGHMLLVDQFLHLNVADDFKELFFVVIQLGAVLSVVVLYWKDIWPFGLREEILEHEVDERGALVQRVFTMKKSKLNLWLKIIIACIPCTILGLFLDDWMDAHFYNPVVIALALIVYGVWFIVLENRNAGKRAKIRKMSKLDNKTALLIGAFQCLALVPGTSRSGSTIIGALQLGVSRKVAATFTFFLAIPVMVGASLLKMVKFGRLVTGYEFLLLFIGMVVAFLVSVFVIRFLIGFIRKNDFKIFGYYRIGLGAVVLIYFAIRSLILRG